MLLVDVGVGEVCIHRQVRDQIAADAVLHVESGGVLEGVGLASELSEPTQYVWLDDKQAAGANVLHAVQPAGLRDPPDAAPAPIPRPEIFFILSPNESAKVYAPKGIAAGGLEVQRAEGDRDGGGPALIVDGRG